MLEPQTQQPNPPDWVQAALNLPLYFALVREDPHVDLAVSKMLPDGAQAIMIASGGCTAAALASSGKFSGLHLVDANKGQILLSLLKLYLLSHSSTAERMALLGHAPMPSQARAARLAEALQGTKLLFGRSESPLSFVLDELGPVSELSRLGPDRAGRYEILFAQLRAVLAPHQAALEAVFSGCSMEEQVALTAPGAALGEALNAAFAEVMSLENLVALFGAAATQNRVQPFCSHFLERTRLAFAAFPAASNPYLADLLLGRFPAQAPLPWFNMQVAPAQLPRIDITVATMSEALRAHPEAFDFVHLSNILDWLTVDEAASLLELAYRALRPGGKVLIRQLNSTLDIAALSRFHWLAEEAAALHRLDRSFFYRTLHLGEKR